jgi:protein TonB
MTVLLTGFLIASVAAGVGLPQTPVAASPLTPADQTARQAHCDQERAKASADGWDMSSIHLSCETGVSAPVRTKTVNPRYTARALKAKIQGVVRMKAVIDADGVVRDVQVIKSLDNVFGLDDEALKAVRASKFTPAKQDGVPVRFLVDIDMQFTLR